MSRRAWLVPMLATMAIQTVLSLNLFALPVVAPKAAPEIGTNPSWLGFYTAIVFGFSILSSLAAGSPVRYWGAVRIGQFCLLMGAIAALLSALGSIPILAIAAVILGLAFGPETPAASHWLARFTHPPNRPLVFSIKQAGIQFGGIIAGLLFPLLLVRFSWHAALIVTGGLSLITAAVLQPLHRSYDTDRDPGASFRIAAIGRALKLVASMEQLRGLAVAGFCFSALQQCLNTFLVIHLVRNLGLPLAAAGFALAVAQVAGVVTRIGSGILADRLVSTKLLLVAMGVIMTLAALGLGSARIEWPHMVLYSVCAAFGLSATGWQGIYLAEVTKLVSMERTSEATGGIVAAAYGGLVFGPVLFSLIVGAGFEYSVAYIAIAMLSLVGTCALALTNLGTPGHVSPLPFA
jgi:MFS family permease